MYETAVCRCSWREPVPSSHSCPEFGTTPREIPHILWVRFYNLPAAAKHSVIHLFLELAQSASHQKVELYPWTTSSQPCLLTLRLQRHTEAETSRRQDHPHTVTLADLSIYLSFFPLFFNLTINLHHQHPRHPCSLAHCQGTARCSPLLWLHRGMSHRFLHSPGDKGVQGSHHLQQNLWLPVDQRPTRWITSPNNFIILFTQ